MISMWRSPRNPHRNPNPSATEFSGSAVNEASFRRSFSMAVRSWPYSSDRVADLGLLEVLDVGDDEPHFARPQGLHLLRVGAEGSDLLDLEGVPRGHEDDFLPGPEGPVEHADEDDHSLIIVEPRIDDEPLGRAFRVALGGRDVPDHPLQDLLDAHSLLGACGDHVLRVQPDHVLDLPLHPVRLRVRQVDLVQDQEDFQVLFQRHVDVRQRLGLHPLRGVHDQDRSLAGAQAAGDLIGEIDVARRIDQVEDVFLPVPGGIAHADGLRLDGDPPLALDVHLVEELVHLLALRERPRSLHQAVGQRGFSVVDVGDDGKVADVLDAHSYHVPAFLIFSRKKSSVRARPSSNDVSGYHPSS
jgi:hypothetical protein